MDFEEQQIDARDNSMVEDGQPQQAAMDAFQFPPLATNELLRNQTMDTNSPLLANGLASQFANQFHSSYDSYQIAQTAEQHQLMLQSMLLQRFWENQVQEIKATMDFKNHSLPLARIKKIMKADEDVKMIAAETPVLFSRACEMFVLELTFRSWSQVEHSKRKTLQRSDISSAIAKYEMFDFLIDIVPMEDVHEVGVPPIPEGEELNTSIPCFYDPSKFGSIMVDFGHSEIVSQGLSLAQQQQDCNALDDTGRAAPT